MIPTDVAERARLNLTYVADRWYDLRARLGGTSGNALTGMPSGSPEPPLPIDVGISDLMREIEDEARSLALVLMDETDWAPRTSAMPWLLAEVASRYGHWTAGDERTALDFCDWAEEYAGRVQGSLERPAPPEYVGPCAGPGEDGAPGECVGDLFLRGSKSEGKCKVCGTAFTREEQRERVEALMRGRLVTQSEGWAALSILSLDVSRSAVKMWVQRGKLTPVEDGLYALADIIDLGRAAGAKRKRVAA